MCVYVCICISNFITNPPNTEVVFKWIWRPSHVLRAEDSPRVSQQAGLAALGRVGEVVPAFGRCMMELWGFWVIKFT